MAVTISSHHKSFLEPARPLSILLCMANAIYAPSLSTTAQKQTSIFVEGRSAEERVQRHLLSRVRRALGSLAHADGFHGRKFVLW